MPQPMAARITVTNRRLQRDASLVFTLAAAISWPADVVCPTGCFICRIALVPAVIISPRHREPVGRGLCGRRFLVHATCVVFTPGRLTIEIRTLLLAWISSDRTDSVKPSIACFDAQYADCSGIERYASADPT